MGAGRSPGGGPRGRSPPKLAVSRHFGCKFPTLRVAFPAYFLVILCCSVVILV